MAAKWSSLGEKHPISYIGLEETLLGGQSFSWTQSAKNQWIGVIGQAVVQLKWNAVLFKQGREALEGDVFNEWIGWQIVCHILIRAVSL